MSHKTAFVIRNQYEQYLDKQMNWQSGKEAQALFRCEHHDEALNTLIEVNAKDISMRGRILEITLDEKRRPIVEVDEQALQLGQSQDTNDEAAISAQIIDNNEKNDQTGATPADSDQTPPSALDDEADIQAKIQAMLDEQNKLLAAKEAEHD